MVPICAKIAPAAKASLTPSSKSEALTISAVGSMVMTTRVPRTASATEPATDAPACESGSVADFDRSQTAVGRPAAIRLRAIAEPMMPVPITATCECVPSSLTLHLISWRLVLPPKLIGLRPLPHPWSTPGPDVRDQRHEVVSVQAQRKCQRRGHDIGLSGDPVERGDLAEGITRSKLQLVAVCDDNGLSLQEQEEAVPLIAPLYDRRTCRPLFADAPVRQLPQRRAAHVREERNPGQAVNKAGLRPLRALRYRGAKGSGRTLQIRYGDCCKEVLRDNASRRIGLRDLTVAIRGTSRSRARSPKLSPRLIAPTTYPLTSTSALPETTM